MRVLNASVGENPTTTIEGDPTMCDDFFEDHFEDDIFDSDTEYEEDLEDEVDGEWYEDNENMIDESGIDNSPVIADNQSDHFDLADAILLGMIGGAIYDTVTDEKRRLNRLKSEDKDKKRNNS